MFCWLSSNHIREWIYTDNAQSNGPLKKLKYVWVSSAAEQKGLRKYQPGFFHKENWPAFHPALRKGTAVQLHRDSVHHMCEVKIKEFDSYQWVWTWRLCLPFNMKHESPQPEESTFSKSSVCYCLYLRKSTGWRKALFTLLPDTPTRFAWGGRKIFKTARKAKHLYVVESYGLSLCAQHIF